MWKFYNVSIDFNVRRSRWRSFWSTLSSSLDHASTHLFPQSVQKPVHVLVSERASSTRLTEDTPEAPPGQCPLTSQYPDHLLSLRDNCSPRSDNFSCHIYRNVRAILMIALDDFKVDREDFNLGRFQIFHLLKPEPAIKKWSDPPFRLRRFVIGGGVD